jgi:hypothetical protein
MKFFPYEKLEIPTSATSEKIISVLLQSPNVQIITRKNDKTIFFIKKPFRKKYAIQITLSFSLEEKQQVLKFEFRQLPVAKAVLLILLAFMIVFLSFAFIKKGFNNLSFGIPVFSIIFIFFVNYLSFYFSHNEDLSELKKIFGRIENG